MIIWMYLVSRAPESWGCWLKFPKNTSCETQKILTLDRHDLYDSFGVFRWVAFQRICSGQLFFLKMLQNSQKWTKTKIFGPETPRNELSMLPNPNLDPLHLKICWSIQKLQNVGLLSKNSSITVKFAPIVGFKSAKGLNRGFQGCWVHFWGLQDQKFWF